MFIAILTYQKPLNEVDHFLAAHREYLAKHSAAGDLHSLEIIRTVFAASETYAVILRNTDEPVGSCGIMFSNGLHSAAMKQGEAEIGYWIGKPYWGQGLIPEAVKALLSRCFNDLYLNTVWCGYYEGNIKSKRVCEKNGFKIHHTNNDIVSPLEDRRTEHFYIIAREDYHAIHLN